MHPEADAFLDAIFDNPTDDTPRLVYADWLQEHGQESYAQFIRLQCEAARYPLWSDAANHLWEEIGRVWNRLADEWWPATRDVWRLPDRAGLLDAVHFRRGFLRPSVRVTAGQLADYTDCWAWLPTPETKLEVTFDCGPLKTVAALPTLRRVRHVCCRGAWSDRIRNYHPIVYDGMDDLLRSPHLCAVTDLDLSMHRLMPSDLETLLTAPDLPTLMNLRVTFDSRDWSYSAGCVSEHEASQRLKDRFPRAECYTD